MILAADSPVLAAAGLWKSYRLGAQEIPVLKDIHMEVASGEYLAIVGQSGAGKSTLLHILGCLDRPTRGSFRVRGESTAEFGESQLARLRNREIGFVFQNFNLLPRLTLEGNVELPLIYLGLPKAERRSMVQQALERMGLWERRHHRPSEVSGGQKQRAAIARALVKKPAVILADEPTGNLDSKTAAEILQVFGELHAEGHTLVVITHDAKVAGRAARVVRLDDGRILGAA